MKKIFNPWALILLVAMGVVLGTIPTVALAVTSYEYVLDEDGLDDGATYALYTNASSAGSNRILYHTGSGDTDKVTGSVQGKTLTLNGSFSASRQEWIAKKVGDGFTLQSVDSRYYLDLRTATSKNIHTSVEPVVLTVVFDSSVKTYAFSANGMALSFDEAGPTNFFSSSRAHGMRLYKKTAVVSAPAQTHFAGTSAHQPFSTHETGSQYFRIPSLTTLSNGWILAASDIRWRTSADSPQNLDTIVSLSKDGGKTWNWEVTNYYGDMAHTATSQSSASFIDPSIMQAADGKVHMVVDACPAYVGLMHGNQMGSGSTGFDNQGRMIVAKAAVGKSAPKTVDQYGYYVDLNTAGEPKIVGEKTVTLHPICDKNTNENTGVWVDAWLNIYISEGNNIVPDMCQQLSSSKSVQKNLFFLNSEWKAFPVFYIMHRTATVTNDGLVWGDPQFLNIKKSVSERFTGVCPGRGLSFEYKGKERLIFPLYDNSRGEEYASTIYSDDNGQTWQRGDLNSQVNGVGKTSESQIVALPDGKLRMYSRNKVNYISYADSSDGGITWGPNHRDNALESTNPGNGCMVSFINIKGVLVSPDNKIYDHVILASYPRVQRNLGVIRLGYMDEKGSVTWLSDQKQFRGNGTFAYSCVTQLPELDQFGLLYEYGPTTNTIEYAQISVADMLGEGWLLVEHADKLPSISLNTKYADLTTGDKLELKPTYSPSDALLDWESTDPKVVSVENGILAAKTAGTADVYATVKVGNIKRFAVVEVTVQDGKTTVIPKRFADTLSKEHQNAGTTYDLVTNGITSGDSYAIFHEDSARILYYAYGKNTTDQVGGRVFNNQLFLNSGFAATTQLWTITGSDFEGYTLAGNDAVGKYLNLNNVTQPGSKAPVTSDAQKLTLTAVDADKGLYTISREVNGSKLYLAHAATSQHYVSTEATNFLLFHKRDKKDCDLYTTSVIGLEKMVTEFSLIEQSEFTKQTWSAFQTMLKDAQTVVAQGSSTYEDEGVAKAAQATIDETARKLYAAKLALAKLAPQPIDYRMIKAPASIVADGTDILFVSEASYDKFKEVCIDGKVVDSSNYSSKSGSTEITLKGAYLKTLAPGNHTLAIVSNDGAATVAFALLSAPANPNQPGQSDTFQQSDKINTDSIAPGAKPNKKPGASAKVLPKTGDSSAIAVVSVMALGVLVGVVGYAVRKNSSKFTW
ncbi:exo-alpha-sialidase [Atopobium fossor]|uniref:exo-alpha-sialidase n=1 Tax=Atopobium fossor TaxID=39487 RepID=UPI00042657AA|nr:exo-alpha-sialidase [Atopobium fossor]